MNPASKQTVSFIQAETLASMTLNHSIINVSLKDEKDELMDEIRSSYTEGKYEECIQLMDEIRSSYTTEGKYEECIPIETSAHMMELLRAVLDPTALLRILVWFLVLFLVYYFAYFFLKFAAILCMNSSSLHILKKKVSHIIREFWFTSRYWMGCLRGWNCDLDPFCGLYL